MQFRTCSPNWALWVRSCARAPKWVSRALEWAVCLSLRARSRNMSATARHLCALARTPNVQSRCACALACPMGNLNASSRCAPRRAISVRLRARRGVQSTGSHSRARNRGALAPARPNAQPECDSAPPRPNRQSWKLLPMLRALPHGRWARQTRAAGWRQPEREPQDAQPAERNTGRAGGKTPTDGAQGATAGRHERPAHSVVPADTHGQDEDAPGRRRTDTTDRRPTTDRQTDTQTDRRTDRHPPSAGHGV